MEPPSPTGDIGCQIPTCLWNGNYHILPGISSSVDSPLPKAGDLLCVLQGRTMTTVADHLDNAGFNTIANSSLLELMYIIHQEKTSLQMDITGSMLLEVGLAKSPTLVNLHYCWLFHYQMIVSVPRNGGPNMAFIYYKCENHPVFTKIYQIKAHIQQTSKRSSNQLKNKLHVNPVESFCKIA